MTRWIRFWRVSTVQLSPKQKEYWTHASHRWNVKEGATRSGKTYLDYYMIPRRIRACHNGGLIVLLGNTQGTLRRNLLDPMREIWTERLVGSTISDNTVQLFGKTAYVLLASGNGDAWFREAQMKLREMLGQDMCL